MLPSLRPEAIREVQEEKKETSARNLQAAVDCVEVGERARHARLRKRVHLDVCGLIHLCAQTYANVHDTHTHTLIEHASICM